MNSAEILRGALSRLAETYDTYSVLPRADFAAHASQAQQWAREQLAALDASPFEPEPEPEDDRRPWAELMGQVFDLWLEALRRSETDEARAKAHSKFAAAVNALCALAMHPSEMTTGGAR